MKRTPWVFILLPLISPPPLLAQDTPRVYPGARIKVTAPECQLWWGETGQVLSLDQGMLIARVGGEEIECPLEALTRLEVSVGERKWWNASLKGTGIGVLGGAVILTVVHVTTCDDEYAGYCDEGNLIAVVIGAVLGGAAGLVTGTIVGLGRDPEDWRTVPLPLVHPTLTLAPDGRFGFGFSVPLKR